MNNNVFKLEPTTDAPAPPEPRPISVIAREIRKTWPKVNYAAEPYLDAMLTLNLITDRYLFEDAKTMVIYFLGNAQTWRGEDARRIKAELKALYN